ncbi:MAG: HAMP domain-containing histidine kinase [Alphaproteobacteria bacterium]|nr:HAMP domain-containing histidine kinase [Alphaproteobacteria bacterium]MDX5494706.1 HAMP domain-containing histidine kinase [Alphaproteobacteria bacterium]
MSTSPRESTSANESHVQSELNALFRDSLLPISLFLAALYALFAILHVSVLEGQSRTIMTLAALGGMSALLIIAAAVRSRNIPARHAYKIGFVMFGIVLANSSLHMLIERDVYQSTNFALIFVAVGLFFLSRRNLLIAFVINFAVWAVCATLITENATMLEHFAVMNLQALLIGLLAIELRLRSSIKLIRMRAEAGERERALEQALTKMKLYASVERDNKAKTEFLANMSHELRTPLNAILGFSEAMEQRLFGPLGNPRYESYVHDIHHAGSHLLSLVNDILDLSRIELDGLKLNPQPIDFARVCNNCLAIVRGRAERGQVMLSLDAVPPFPAIETDERRLKQVIINLLNNAVKFTPAGGRVTLELAHGSNGGAIIRIRDTGIGMGEEELESALRPFWQADVGLDRTFEGAGLGLALVTELVSLMEGDFRLESEPGKGTVATVVLPPTCGAEKTAAA